MADVQSDLILNSKAASNELAKREWREDIEIKNRGEMSELRASQVNLMWFSTF